MLSSRDWPGKAAAGLILGFALALGLCGVFARFGPGAIGFFSAEGQVTMWLMAPLWCLALSFCFLFPSGRSAWAWFGLANGAIWGLLAAVGFVGG